MRYQERLEKFRSEGMRRVSNAEVLYDMGAISYSEWLEVVNGVRAEMGLDALPPKLNMGQGGIFAQIFGGFRN